MHKWKLEGFKSLTQYSLLLRRLVFRMAEASAKRVTGDEPQRDHGKGTDGCLLPAFLCAHIERDVWVRGRIQYLFLTQRIHFLKDIIIHYYSFKILPLF